MPYPQSDTCTYENKPGKGFSSSLLLLRNASSQSEMPVDTQISFLRVMYRFRRISNEIDYELPNLSRVGLYRRRLRIEVESQFHIRSNRSL